MLRRMILLMLLLCLLTACAAPAYVPDDATLAEREAAEYATRVERGKWAWRVFLGATIVGLCILLGLVFFLAQVRYRVADAEARKKSRRRRRALLVAWRRESVRPGKEHHPRHDGAARRRQVDAGAACCTRFRRSKAMIAWNGFMTNGALIVGWESKSFPHWQKWTERGKPMTGDEWVATDK